MPGKTVAVDAVLTENLKRHVRNLSVPRHGVDNYHELEMIAEYIEKTLRSYELQVTSQYFQFQKRQYRNVIATIEGARPDLPALVLGAHYDGNRGTPGADDNASGVAVMLEAARVLRESSPVRRLEVVAFALEEPQTFTHIIRRGSRYFARQARKAGARYEGALILECVGYISAEQKGALLAHVTGLDVPRERDFLAVVSNRRSKDFMERFVTSANDTAPSLRTVGYAAPAHGYLLPQVRFSDHSSFWEREYPAIMLNDTVMFRNPNYHEPTDTPETLNYCFMTDVARAVVTIVAGYG